jgi:hypothetical protein
MELKSLLREYLEIKNDVQTVQRHNFLPNFQQSENLPVKLSPVPWERTGDLEWSVKFQRREDLRDFVDLYLQLEDEFMTYARLTVNRYEVVISSDEILDSRFKSKIEEIARETRGN